MGEVKPETSKPDPVVTVAEVVDDAQRPAATASVEGDAEQTGPEDEANGTGTITGDDALEDDIEKHSDTRSESDVEPRRSRTSQPQRPVTCAVRYYNYEGFMNRTVGDEGDYVIEVLMAKPNWNEDVTAELSRRADLDAPTTLTVRTAPPALHGSSKPGISSDPEAFGGSRRFQRVRIRSKTVLDLIERFSEMDVVLENPTVFPRPFRTFEAAHEGVKKELNEMTDHAHQKQVDGDDGVNTSDQAGLDELRCYVNFVEERILPLRHQIKDHGMVRYDDIPSLFRVGDLVYVPPETKLGKTLHRSAAQVVWRLAELCPADCPNSILDGKFSMAGLTRTKAGLYSLDSNGEELLTVWSEVSFKYFEGEKDVASLECYPVSFHPKAGVLLKERKEMGHLFKLCVLQGVKHLYYSGWTFVTGIQGETLQDDRGVEIKYPEYIESEVVIDFKETLRNCPTWQTDSARPDITYGSWIVDHSELEFRHWQRTPAALPPDSPVAVGSTDRLLNREDALYRTDKIRYLQQDRFLNKRMDVNSPDWTPEDEALFPVRLFGYVLRERKFAHLDAGGIQWDNKQNEVKLEHIHLKDSHRKIIKSAVSSHFKSRQKERESGVSAFNLDPIRGKGKGLVILLHGAPGVGKTATAEAVAIENNKPLFAITCGDLGSSPSAVDKTLRDIFRYAHLWDCILLLDEADVFLTQRERLGSNLERNALVGVFLRVLEYYSGVLFLTTNRVGTLDEAFRSRVHISLYYPHLSKDHTSKILRDNLQRLPRHDKVPADATMAGLIKVHDDKIVKFVEAEYDKYSKRMNKPRGPWNGRQIRNAVQVAACLALYEKETEDKDDGLPAYLSIDHFQTVADTTSEFEKYMKKAKAGDDAAHARRRQERYDDWTSDEDDEDTVQFSRYKGRSESPRTPASSKPVPASSNTPGSFRGGSRSGGPAPPKGRRPSMHNHSHSHAGSSRFPGSRSNYSYHEEEERDSHDYLDEDIRDDLSQERTTPLRSRRPPPRRHGSRSEYHDGGHELDVYSDEEENDGRSNANAGPPRDSRSVFGQKKKFLWDEMAPTSDDRDFRGEREREKDLPRRR